MMRCVKSIATNEGSPITMSNTLLYVITVLIWGSTWFAIEFQLGVAEPEVSVAYRYAGASVLLFLWSAIRGLQLKFDLRAHAWFALLGFLLFGLNYILAYRAQIYLASALSALVFASMVWMNIINARIFFGIRAGRHVLIGAALGMLGMFTLFAPQVSSFSLSDSILYGSLLAVGGALLASFGNMVSQRAQRLKLPVIQSNAWGMFYGALLTAAYSFASGYEFNFEWTVSYGIALAYLTVFGSIVAFGAYLTLLGRIGAHKAGYAMVMFPVVALLFSLLFEGMRLSLSIVIGTALVLAGNVFILRNSPSKPRKSSTLDTWKPEPGAAVSGKIQT